MTLSVNAKTYTADRVNPDYVAYSGPSHTLSLLDVVQLKRVYPKPVSNNSGVARYNCKLTRTVPLTAALTLSGSLIGDMGFNVPVGTAAADIDTMCADLGAFIASNAFKTQLKALTVNL